MKLVIDASVIIAAILDEPERDWAIAATLGGEALAPRSLPFEIGNALTGLVKRKRLSADGMQKAGISAVEFQATLCEIDVGAALRLAGANGLYAYDAYMLQCAVERNATLVTLDRRMIAVGRTIGLDILEHPN